ncbi:hypothetical protein BpHYR1_003414 [Brachionus plicatilis]|uniref:Uncharacterized protein n=1 Tax=Brachionus plicatilis TaxID=10195 RepID=A0A3M7RD86_BRAPC|nr:hypothetical protein BpHYR1_003414 [Brachionus plicatilis]
MAVSKIESDSQIKAQVIKIPNPIKLVLILPKLKDYRMLTILPHEFFAVLVKIASICIFEIKLFIVASKFLAINLYLCGLLISVSSSDESGCSEEDNHTSEVNESQQDSGDDDNDRPPNIGKYSLKIYIHKIDQELASIRVPQFIPRIP